MTTVAPDVRLKRIALTFARQYYTNFVQNPEKLSAFYGATASVNHGNDKTATGVEQIAKLFAKIYSTPHTGTVSISDVETKTLENGNYEITIYGIFHPTDRKSIQVEFTHVVELNEGLTGHFAVVGDKRSELIVPKAIMGMDTWASETPPMFAAHNNEPTPAPLALTNSQAKPNGSAPAVAPTAEAKPAAEAPQAAAAPAPAEEAPAKEAEAAEKPAPAQKKEAAEKKPEAEAKPAAEPASKSFLDAVRKQRSAAAGTAAAPIRVSAAPAQPAEKPQAPAAAKKAASPKESEEKPAPKREPKAAAAPGGNGNAKDGAAPRKKRETEKAPRGAVVFYDIIVKGLPETTTEEAVNELISPIMPIKQLKVQSQKGKQDKDVTRTFAFVQLDHAKITESGSDVKAAVAKVLAETKNKRINGTRIMLEEVREKFLSNAPERSS